MKNIDNMFYSTRTLDIMKDTLVEKLSKIRNYRTDNTIEFHSDGTIVIEATGKKWSVMVGMDEDNFKIFSVSKLTILDKASFELFIQIKNVIIDYMNQEEGE